jgi:hypothetical protein
MRRALILGIVIGLTIPLAAACRTDGTSQTELAVEPPLAEASVFESRRYDVRDLYVRLVSTARLGSIVAVGIDPLEPGMDLEQAESVAGPAVWSRSDEYSSRYRFEFSEHVELVHITAPSSGGRLDKWVVQARPSDTDVSTVFRAPLAELIGRAGAVTEVTIHEDTQSKRSAFTAKVRQGHVRDLEWYSIADAPRLGAAERGNAADKSQDSEE